LPGLKPCHYPRNPSGSWRPLRRVFGLSRASVCGSGLKGRFPVAQGAALGQGHPQTNVFRPEGPISRRVLFSCSCTGFPGGSAETGPSGLVRVFGRCRDQVLTHLALLRSALQAWGRGAVVDACLLCAVHVLRFRPEELFSGSPGRSPRNARFCSGDGSPEHAAPRPEVGQRPRTTLPRASPDGLGAEVTNLFLNSQRMHSTITIGG
jgi:hypothetical protein